MSQPLFILAPPRSFTSVVCAMIGNHPEMLGIPETNLFAADTLDELSRLYKLKPRFQHGLLRAVAELGLGEQSQVNIELAKSWLADNGSVTTADIFRDLMTWAAPRRLVDKSPMYVYAPDALARIESEFPDARYLHLTRHPRATCESIYELRNRSAGGAGGALRKRLQGLGGRGNGAGGDQSLNPESMWLKPHLRAQELLELVDPERQMRLRGEVLLEQPELYLRQIAEWLEISTDEAAIAAMMRPEESPFACLGPDNARFGNDPSFLESPSLRPYKAKPQNLDDPLSWDPELEFDETVKQYALMWGYG